MTKKKIWLFFFLVISVSLLLFFFKIREDMVDFEVNFKAAQRLQVGETLYRLEDEHYQFKYMPVSSFLYLPLTLLSLDAAKLVWFFFIVSAFLGIVFLSVKLVDPEQNFFGLLSLIPPLVLAKYFLREFQLGQINSIVTLILFVVTWLLTEDRNKDRQTLTGLSWGLAVALKPYALIFLPYLIIKRKWKALAWGWALLAALFFIPSAFYGIRGNITVHKEWFATFSQSTPTLLTTQDNVSIIAFFSKWIDNQNLALLLTAVSICILALLILFLFLRGKTLKRAPVLECSVLLICIPLVSPLGWDYTFFMSILGLVLILKYFKTYPLFWKTLLFTDLGILSLSLYDLLGTETYALFMSWSILTLNFLILIGYLAFLRIKKIA